jgi:hypothetical protein
MSFTSLPSPCLYKETTESCKHLHFFVWNSISWKLSPQQVLIQRWSVTHIQAQGSEVVVLATSRHYTMQGGIGPWSCSSGSLYTTLSCRRGRQKAGGGGAIHRMERVRSGYGASGSEQVRYHYMQVGLGGAVWNRTARTGHQQLSGWSLTCMLSDVASRVPAATSKSPAVFCDLPVHWQVSGRTVRTLQRHQQYT